MIAILFALRDESRDFSRMVQNLGRTGPHGFPAIPGASGQREVVLFHTGMGADRTRERLLELWSGPPVDCVISAGYAGGLDPALPAGALVLAGNYSDPELLARAGALLKDRARTVTMTTCPTAAETRDAKASLAKTTGASVVDMETATIAEQCRSRGVPLLSVRVVSDPAGEELAVPFSVCFDALTERPRPGTLLAFLLRHPSRIPAFIRFVRAINRARHRLACALVELLTGLP